LRLKIKDSDGQVKELRDDKQLIELKEEDGKLRGKQYVKFKRDGKEYNVLVDIEAKRGFIKDSSYSAKFEIPENADFSYYHEKDGSS